jgi:hypothetical protein
MLSLVSNLCRSTREKLVLRVNRFQKELNLSDAILHSWEEEGREREGEREGEREREGGRDDYMRIIWIRKNYFADQILAVGHDQLTHQTIRHLIRSSV